MINSKNIITKLFPIILSLTDCKIATPFMGENYGRKLKQGIDPNQKVILVITHAKLDKTKNTSLFWRNVDTVKKDILEKPGFIGFSIRRKLFGDEVWTMSAWEDETSLENFIYTHSHEKAIEQSSDTLELNHSVRIELPRKMIPIPWEEAERELEKKISKK
jgi:heme-degrading monooxygenase HmoA